MTYDEVADKFRECAEFARFDESKAKEIVAKVRDLEKVAAIGELTALLATS